jgi:hypothetical protein
VVRLNFGGCCDIVEVAEASHTIASGNEVFADGDVKSC